MFENFKIYETTFGGRPMTFETGKMCGLSNGSVLVRWGETVVLVNVTASAKPREGIDFFPLSVDFEEKLYSVGKIPGSFIKRESRPSDKAILASRLVDRPIRPLFPKDMRNDCSVVMTVMSVDPDCLPEIAGMIGTSFALSISDIPWNGPIAGANIGLVNGEIIVCPDAEQRRMSDLNLTVAANEDVICMIEAGANEVSNEVMLDAIIKGHEEIKKMVRFIKQVQAEIGKPKFTFESMEVPHDLFDEVEAFCAEDVKFALDTDNKVIRDERLAPIVDRVHAAFDEKTENPAVLDEVLYKLQKKIVRRWLLDEQKRVDGRKMDEIRPLAAEVSLLPRVHGSGMFTRGQTQVLTIATLGTISEAQKLDGIDDQEQKRYIHHYNFPSYSVGETRPSRGPGRREIGHGALAERALLPVLPSEEEFPYAIRVVSEVVSSNGSTSQGSICGSTLALMDAGVPIKAPVAGISCGLIQDDDGSFTTFIDIQGVEDFHGEMDFKVGGTKKGITAIQMDLKNDGLTMEIIKNALDITYDARCEILDQIMLPCIDKPRPEVSQWAPKMITMHIDPDNIRDVIGKGGSVIQKIVADTGAKIDIEDDGTIHIASPDSASAEAAKAAIDQIVFVPEVGSLYYGRVVRLMQFGAFVELAPGKDGLVHISKLANKRVEKVEDVCKIGDMMWVKVTEIDEKGRVNLSHKDAVREIEEKKARGEVIK